MAETIRDYLPWLLSCLSLLMSVLTGNLWRWAWIFGIGIQCLWLLWIAVAHVYGFLPLCLALFVIYGRNHLRWRKPQSPRDQWIEISAAMPDEWRDALLIVDGQMRRGFWFRHSSGALGWAIEGHDAVGENVRHQPTHWMRMPAGPVGALSNG